MSRRVSLFALLASFFVVTAFSCVKEEIFAIEPELEPDSSSPDTVAVYVKPADDPKLEPVDLDGPLTITPFAELNYKHQSAAVYGDYAFFVRDGRSAIRLYDLARKQKIYTCSLQGGSSTVYHSNQSSFGTEKYDSRDFFPLLYISQRPRSDRRCFVEIFRIIPLFNADSTALVTFRTELVQEVFLPPMSRENSMGNANCVIDTKTGKMYTYSRNNNREDDNYAQCKISRFAIPDINQKQVFLEDSDIESSFMIDARAINMQGGCIVDGFLYIGQGYPPGDVHLNVVNLQEERLVKRYDLLAKGCNWEPEGCFYYDGNVMLSYKTGISRIVEEE